ncbi:hypothetical protein [Breznakia pachnodae]|uniref:DNA-directed RNA polymerase subunit RPC12/RpoP/cell division protein FtsB n=1 Tax=Breznakia pachnodae TaxID=265178 RepID=A0ABU0E142_9FIRM|nr:hypothetical protein [Breznakia pachnodae]MDQ0360443.1 DNA-directed RNA polymerase subunit RPC12/RpoP/cell division protein FtsB [Breznakia pachnodae]
MPFINVKCESCGGDVQLDDALKQGFCMYCGSKIVFVNEQTNTGGKDLTNLLILAKTAYNNANYEETLRYANEILEVKLDNYEAWELKGKASGHLSTIDNIRIKETTFAFEKAIENSPKNKNEYRVELAETYKELCNAVIDKCTNVDTNNWTTQSSEKLTSAMALLATEADNFLGTMKNTNDEPLNSEVLIHMSSKLYTAGVSIYNNAKGFLRLPDSQKTGILWQEYINKSNSARAMLLVAIDHYQTDFDNKTIALKELIDINSDMIYSGSYEYKINRKTKEGEYVKDKTLPHAEMSALVSENKELRAQIKQVDYDKVDLANQNFQKYREEHAAEYERLVAEHKAINAELDEISDMPGFLIGDKAKKKKELKKDAERRFDAIRELLKPFGGVRRLD